MTALIQIINSLTTDKRCGRLPLYVLSIIPAYTHTHTHTHSWPALGSLASKWVPHPEIGSLLHVNEPCGSGCDTTEQKKSIICRTMNGTTVCEAGCESWFPLDFWDMAAAVWCDPGLTTALNWRCEDRVWTHSSCNSSCHLLVSHDDNHIYIYIHTLPVIDCLCEGVSLYSS